MLRALHTPGPKHVVRGQYGRGFVEGEEVPAYREEAGRRARLDDRDLRRREALRRQLALGGHAVLRPRGQAARAARDDDRDPVQARAAPAVRGRRRRRRCGRTCSSCHIQPDEGVSLAFGGQGARPGDDAAHRAHGLPLRRRLPHRDARGLRAADPRLPARRRDAVHARGRGRGAVGARRRDRRGLAARPAGVPELRGGHAGARRPRTSCSTGTAARGDGTEGSMLGEIERELAAQRARRRRAGGSRSSGRA